MMTRIRIYILFFAVAWASPLLAQVDVEDIVCNLENEDMRKYLDAAAQRYHDVYENTSIVNIYNHSNSDVREDTAVMPVISLPSAYSRPLKIHYGLDGNIKDISTITIGTEAEYASIPCLVPGNSYFYYVEDCNANIVRQGLIQTKGRTRLFNFENIHNMRDLGGWPAADGYTLCYEKLYRGGELKGDKGNATADDIAAMRAIGINAELDFRDALTASVQNGVSVLGEDCPYMLIDMEDTGTQFADNKEDYARAFRFLLDNLRNGRSTYIHCTYGADRTGMFCAMLEALAGVHLADIYKDFELSSFSSIVSPRTKLYLNRRLYNIKGSFPPDKPIGQYMADYALNDLKLTQAEIDEFAKIMTGRSYVPTGAQNLNTTTVSTHEYYGLDGTRRQGSLHGINLIRLTDGNVRKVIIK